MQRKAANRATPDTVPPIVHEVLRASGQPLDSATRAYMEPRFGHDFSQVRVHTGVKAAESAQAVNALAYTLGQDLVFGSGQYTPGTRAGRQLLAHELAHAIQQNGVGNRRQPSSQLTINQPGDVFEQEADAAAGRIAAGSDANSSALSAHPMLQRETPASGTQTESEEEKDAGEVVAEGIKTVAEQAADNNPKVKKVIIEPIKDRLKGQWNRLSTGEKATAISFGVATLGLTGGTLLSDPGGREQLEGINLAAPLQLVPYVPLSSFKYKLPSGDSPEARLLKFETGFKADELLNLRAKRRGLPKMSLSVNMQWGFDPASDRLTVLGGDATLGLVPGLSLSAGAYKDVLRPTPTFAGAEGQTTQLKKRVPEFDKPQPIPDVRVMLKVDLLKFKPGDLARQIRGIF